MVKLVTFLAVVGLMALSASAAIIDSSNNGDFSFGDTTNWSIEDDGAGNPSFVYDAGTLRGTQLTPAVTQASFHHNQLAPPGAVGSIDLNVISMSGNGGELGVSFLGDPVKAGGGVAEYDNNDSKRGYVVVFANSWGTVTATLARKVDSWNRVDLDSTTMPLSDLQGWHTLSIDDNAGDLVVSLDAGPILSASEGASYLPTVYAGNYAGGGYWGGYGHSVPSKVDVQFDNLYVIPEPASAAILLVGVALARVRRKR